MSHENILKSLQQSSSATRFPLLLNQNFLCDEFTIEYDRKTTIYRLSIPPSQEQEQQPNLILSSFLSSYELLAFFSSNYLSFASKYHDASNEILDFPSHLLPSLETSLITFPSQNEKNEGSGNVKNTNPFLYLRLPLLKTSGALTLYQHLSAGKWVSEKLLFRWTIQILRTLKLAHERFLTFPSFDSQQIHLLSDESLLATYRLQLHSIKQRNKKQEEDMKNTLKSSRAVFGSNSHSSFNSSAQHEDMKLPDIPPKKIQFKPLLAKPPAAAAASTMSSISGSNSVFSASSSSLMSQVTSQLHPRSELGRLAPRKDAWLLLPFDDHLTPIEDPLEMSQALELKGDEGNGKEGVLPKISRGQSFRRQLSADSVPPAEQDQLDSSQVLQQSSLSAWLRRYQVNPRDKEHSGEGATEAGEQKSMFQLVAIAFSESVPTEIADQCRQNYASFIRSAYQDLRSLGSILIEAYLRRPLSPLERKLVQSPSFGMNDLFSLNSFDRLSKGMMELLQLCYTPLPAGTGYSETVMISPERHTHHHLNQSQSQPKMHVIRSPLLQREEEILTAIEKEFHDLGGFDPRVSLKDTPLGETSYWTKEVQEEEEQKKAERVAELERKAKVGKKQANRRNIQRRKQLLFDMLPEEQQQVILRKKYFRKLALSHRKERNQLIHKALFHRWGMNKMRQWLQEALLNCLKKNYYFKKSGVRLSLEQKHEWDRTVRPIERAIGKILLVHPYIPPVVKIEGAQALLLQLKDHKQQDPLKTTLPTSASAAQAQAQSHRPSSADEDVASNPSPYSSPSHSRPSTADPPTHKTPHIQAQGQGQTGEEEEELEEKIIELDEMSSHEKEIRYLHCFDFACQSLSSLLANEAGTTLSVFEDRDLKASLTVAKFTQKAVETATETLEKSAVASNLPPEQFRNKMLVTAAKKLGSWDAINVAVNSFGQILGIRDRQWFTQMIGLVSFSIVTRYDTEERIRTKGEAVAASRIQGVGRGYIARKKIKEIWRLADEQFAREEERRLEREKEEEEMNKILSKARGQLKRKGEEEEGEAKKEKLFKDEDAAWVGVATHALNSSQLEVFLTFQKDCVLPKDENRRSLQIKPIARILRQPGVIPDPYCSTPAPPLVSSSAASPPSGWMSDDPNEGLIEVIIDDLKRIIKIRQDWTQKLQAQTAQDSSKAMAMVECTLKWEDISQRNKRLSSSLAVEDEAAAFLQLSNLIPHRRYRLKIMVNSRYRPPPGATPTVASGATSAAGGVGQKKKGSGSSNKFVQVKDDPEEIRLSRAGYLTILTDPDPPVSPEFLPPDLIHYDHKTSAAPSTRAGGIPLQLQLTEKEQFALLLEDREVSVVDKLEKYKSHLLEAKRISMSTAVTRGAAGAGSGATTALQKSVKNNSGSSWSKSSDGGDGVTERRVSCRLHWTIPYSNGNRVVEYQIQRLMSDHSSNWESLTTTRSTHFTDTLPASATAPTTATYRVRAANEFGWSPYSAPFSVDLIDKISSSSAREQPSSPSRSPAQSQPQSLSLSLLPHGITLSDHTTSLSPARLLSSRERDTLVHSNMYALPPTVVVAADHCSTQMAGTESETSLGAEPLGYGKNPSRHPDSTLAGETLFDVNKSLEQWLCRLADTCPLDEMVTKPLRRQEQEERQGDGEDTEQEQEEEVPVTFLSTSKETKRNKKMKRKGQQKSERLHSSSLPSSSVLESIYQLSGITENDTPIPRRPQGTQREGGEGQGQEGQGGNMIQKLVVSSHKTKIMRPPTQSLSAKALANQVYLPK